MENEPWQIAAARFCVDKVEFSLHDLELFLEEKYQVPQTHIRDFFTNKIQQPSGHQFNRQHIVRDGLWYYTAPLELASTIVDFDEIKLARENAQSAWKISMWALGVAAIGSIFQALSFIWAQ